MWRRNKKGGKHTGFGHTCVQNDGWGVVVVQSVLLGLVRKSSVRLQSGMLIRKIVISLLNAELKSTSSILIVKDGGQHYRDCILHTPCIFAISTLVGVQCRWKTGFGICQDYHIKALNNYTVLLYTHKWKPFRSGGLKCLGNDMMNVVLKLIGTAACTGSKYW